MSERNNKRRKVFVKTPGNSTKTRYLAEKPGKAVCHVTGQELHGMKRKGATEASNSSKSSKRPERPYGGTLSSEAARKKIKMQSRVQDGDQIADGNAITVGRMVVKIAGRDAGLKGVIVEVHSDGSVTVDGQTRRRKVSVEHIEPLADTIDVKKGASHSDVKKAFSKLNIEIKDTKPKTAKKPEKKGKSEKKKKSDKKAETVKDDKDSSGSKASSDEKKSVKKEAKTEKPSESEIRSMTKDEMQEFAEKKFGIELDTNNLKDEMVENFLKNL